MAREFRPENVSNLLGWLLVRLPNIPILIAANLAMGKACVLRLVRNAKPKYTSRTIVYGDSFRNIGDMNI